MSDRKTALVTGSSSGIGLAIAKNLAEAGMDVILNGLEAPETMQDTLREIENSHSVRASYRPANLMRPEEIEALMAHAQQEFGGVDVLVNNAGIQFVAPVEEFPPAKWEAIISLNLSAAFYTIHAVAAQMKRNGWGRIVNIASAHGLVASPYKSAYVAAKHGIVGLTKTVGLELAEHGVTVNAICPGYVWTPLVERQIPDTAAARGISEQEVIDDVLLKAQPTKKFVSVDEVAALTRFLCSDNASSITGSALAMDGGWTAQ